MQELVVAQGLEQVLNVAPHSKGGCRWARGVVEQGVDGGQQQLGPWERGRRASDRARVRVPRARSIGEGGETLLWGIGRGK